MENCMKRRAFVPVPIHPKLKRKHLKLLNKALLYGFYYKSSNKILKASQDLTHLICVHHVGYDIEICYIHWGNYYKAPVQSFKEFSLDAYGRTWALTKEELQKD